LSSSTHTAPSHTRALTGSMLISIRPNFADAILSGIKTVEVRRLRPAADPGTVAYVYASAPRKAMLGLFQIDSVVT
jgi:predicted transcriptional regulator